mmetsp:Transcript_11864/g.34021  ORF Transcript_11864/g.34021 Transcript_11864/m.34021 type:complete len:544 (+) Transcript_11864:89-1720(+)
MQTDSGSPLSKRQKADHEDDLPGTVPALDLKDPNDGRMSLPRQRCVHDQKSLHIAPMIRVSNREFRQLIRILSKRCVLWTEMVVDETIYYCSRSKSSSGVTIDGITGPINRENVDIHLDYDRSVEHPIVCQIGGIGLEHTAFTSRIVVKEYGYDEVNLNMGCPSNRVSGKGFGAVLMKNIDGACDLVKTLKNNCDDVPVSVKLRIGVDDMEDFAFIREIIRRLSEAGCDRFYMHARKVLLQGLNPAENRIVPPLNYPIVYRLCEAFPQCNFWINGGISGLRAAKALVYGDNDKEPKNGDGIELASHSVPCTVCNYPNGSCIAPRGKGKVPTNLRGCMLGRAAMDNPALFWDCDRYFYGEAKNPCRTRREVLDQYIEYLEDVYPRRCCDDIDTETKRIPSPSLIHTGESCIICSEWRKAKASNSPTSKISSETGRTLPVSNCRVVYNGSQKKKRKKPKITTHVIRRALRPVLGIFVGLSTNKTFRRRCEDLTQDLAIRECGPAFVLVSALQSVPDEVLDAEFNRTEDLPASNIVEHVSPQQISS